MVIPSGRRSAPPLGITLPDVSIYPGLLARRQSRGDAFVPGGFVRIGARELLVRYLQDRATDAAVVSPVEPDDGVMRLATRRDELRVFDLQQCLLEPNELVRLAVKQPTERRQLHGALLERAVRKEERHDAVTGVDIVARRPLSSVASRVSSAPSSARGRSTARTRRRSHAIRSDR